MTSRIRSLVVTGFLLSAAALPAGTLTWDIASGDGAAITGGPGVWQTSSGNWNSGATDAVWSAGDIANFSSATASSVTMGSAVSASGITAASGAGNVTLSATAVNALSMTAGASVDVASGSTLTIDGTGANFTANGAGFTIAGGGVFEVRGGTTTVAMANGGGFTLGSGTTLQLDSGATFQYSSGNTTAAMSGGVLALNGGTFVVGGGLSDTIAAGVTGSGILSYATPSTGGPTLNFTGPVTGSGTISLRNVSTNGAGLQIMGGDNSGFTGTFALDAGSGLGVVRFDSLAAAGAGNAAVTVAAGNTLLLNVGGSRFAAADVVTLLGKTAFASGAKLGFDTTGGAFTYSNVIADGANPLKFIRMGGSNDLTLSGANTYTGGTTLSAGRTIIGNAAAFGTGMVTVSNGAQVYGGGAYTVANNFTIAGVGASAGSGNDGRGSLRPGNSTYQGGITLAANARISGAGSETGTFSGVIDDGGHGYQLEIGSATGSNNLVTVTLNAANTYSGGTLISGGTSVGTTAIAGNDSAFGTGAITLNGGFLNTNGKTLANAIAVAAGAGTGGIKFGSNATLNGAITGSGALNLTPTAASSLYLNGDMSGYTGTITMGLGGNITAPMSTGVASNNTGSTGAAFVVNTTGSYGFSINRGTFAMGSLAGSGKVLSGYNTGVVSTLSVGALGTDTVFSGSLLNNGSGVLAVVKTGSGSLTLTGASTHTGGMTLNAGTLVTGNVSALGSGNVTLAGGVLKIGDGNVAAVTLVSGKNLVATGDATLVFSDVAGAINLTGGKYDFTGRTVTLDLAHLSWTHTSGYQLITGGSGNADAASYNIVNGAAGYAYGFSNGLLSVSVVPEPAACGLLGAGVTAASAIVRRRKRRVA